MASYNKSYTVVVARSIDIMLAGWIWREADVTISSMCGLALRLETPPIWSIVLGRWFLNRIEKNHCELAIQADRLRAHMVLQLLGE